MKSVIQMNLIFAAVYAFWLISEIIINRILRPSKTKDSQTDRGSLTLIWIAVFLGIFAAIYVANRYYYPLLENEKIRYVGLIIICLGIIFRIIIIKTLGDFFTVTVAIRQNHQLKKDGFYKYVRHPSYSASLLSFIGFGISLNNILALLIVFTFIFIAFAFRIKIEENTLIAHFGDEYINYKKKTKKLIPFMY